MKGKWLTGALVLAMAAVTLAGCGAKDETKEKVEQVTLNERTGGFMRKMHGKEDRGIKYRERGSSPGRRKRGKTCHRWKCCLRDR